MRALYPKTSIQRLRHGIWEGISLIFFGAILAVGSNAIRQSGLPWIGQWSSSAVAASYLQGLDEISLKEAWFLYEKGKALFVDARNTMDFRQGHIAGAVSVPPGEAEHYLEEISILSRSGREVVVYCDGVDCPLSPQLARTFKERGVTVVKVFVDGWHRWREAGYPIEEGGR